MKKIFALLTVLALLFCVSALAETANVTSPEQLLSALNDPAVDAIEITDDMTITDSYVMQTKDVTILSDVVFQPAPDDGFFVKSWEVPEGVKLIAKTGFGYMGLKMEMDMNFPRPPFYNAMFDKWGLETGPEWKK